MGWVRHGLKLPHQTTAKLFSGAVISEGLSIPSDGGGSIFKLSYGCCHTLVPCHECLSLRFLCNRPAGFPLGKWCKTEWEKKIPGRTPLSIYNLMLYVTTYYICDILFIKAGSLKSSPSSSKEANPRDYRRNDYTKTGSQGWLQRYHARKRKNIHWHHATSQE